MSEMLGVFKLIGFLLENVASWTVRSITCGALNKFLIFSRQIKPILKWL